MIRRTEIARKWRPALGLSITFGALLLMTACVGAREETAPTTTEIAYSQLPLMESELPPGPNRELLVMQCLSCHTPAYVTMQPAFSRKVWEAEVTKMVNVYGAQIRPYDQKLIVDYLMTVRGDPPLKAPQ